MAEHHAVQILTQNDSGKYVLNEEELEKVLTQPEVAENPVALYSVSGPFRKGKSFLLNLFLEYLWNNRNEKWKKNAEKSLDKGFPWRGGRERDTQGILIWTEPFVVEINGKQVAVLLMDTQGTFDMNTSMQGNSLVFALSTLISSMQIYNLSQQVSENDLQALQLFTEIGKLAQAESTDVTAFQSLFFLIRDWSDDDIRYGLESGTKYLEEILAVNKQKEISKITTSIKTSFEKKECFLMPEPNREIRNRGKTKGPCKIKEIGEDFLGEAQALMDHIFSDSNLAIKKVNGKEVTGVDLLNYTISYINQLNSDEMAQAITLFQASADTYWLNAVRQCLKRYKKEMQKVLRGKHICDVELKRQNNKVTESVRELYHKRRKMGKDSIAQKYERKLVRRLKKEFTLYRCINLQNEKTHILECKELIAESKESLQNMLEEKFLNVDYLEEQSFQDVFEKFKEKILEDLKDKFNSGTTDSNLVKKLEEHLFKTLNKICNNYQELNTKSKEKYQSRLQHQANAAKRQYLDEVNAKTKGSYVEKDKLAKIHDKALKLAWATFDIACISDPPGSQIAIDIRNQLEKDLSVEQMSSYHNNERYKSNVSFEAVSTAKSKYIEEMNQELGNAIQSLDYLEECHKKAIQKARQVLETMLSSCDSNTKQKCLENLQQEAQEIFKLYKRTFEEADLETYMKYKTEALKQYKIQMKVTQLMTNAQSIEKFHQKSLEQAQEYVRKKTMKMSCSTYECLKDLEAAISNEYSNILQERADENTIKQDIQETAIQEAVTTYINYMKQITEGKYTWPELLLKQHEKLKAYISKMWNLNNGYEVPSELSKAFEDAFHEIEEENKENKDLWLRTQTKLDPEIKAEKSMFTKMKNYWERVTTERHVKTNFVLLKHEFGKSET